MAQWSPRVHELVSSPGPQRRPARVPSVRLAEGPAPAGRPRHRGHRQAGGLPARRQAARRPDEQGAGGRVRGATSCRRQARLRPDHRRRRAGRPGGLGVRVVRGPATLTIEREAIGGQAGSSSLIRNYLGLLARRERRRAGPARLPAGVGVRDALPARCEVTGHAHRGRAPRRRAGRRRGGHRARGDPRDRRRVPAARHPGPRGAERGRASSTARPRPRRGSSPARTCTSWAAATPPARPRCTCRVRAQRVHRRRAADPRARRCRSTCASWSSRTSSRNVKVLYNTEVVECIGRGRLEGLALRDNARGKARTVPAGGLFVMIGARPRTDWLSADIEVDELGYVKTGPDAIQAKLGRNLRSRRTGCSSRWKRACRACSRSATCATTRCGGSRQPSARARWSCGRCWSTWRTRRPHDSAALDPS